MSSETANIFSYSLFFFFPYHALDRKTEIERFTLDSWWDRNGFGQVAFMGLTIRVWVRFRRLSRATSSSCFKSEGLGRPNCCADRIS